MHYKVPSARVRIARVGEMRCGIVPRMSFEGHTVCIVVAIGKNRELGMENQLLWHIPEDLRRFKTLTLGHPVIMGRKTFESIVKVIGKPLPERTNIVISRTMTGFVNPSSEVIVAHSLEEALNKASQAPGGEEIHIGGGAQVYEHALQYVDKLCLTLIDDEKPADSFFPAYDTEFTKKTFEESQESNGLKYRWVNLQRV